MCVTIFIRVVCDEIHTRMVCGSFLGHVVRDNFHEHMCVCDFPYACGA